MNLLARLTGRRRTDSDEVDRSWMSPEERWLYDPRRPIVYRQCPICPMKVADFVSDCTHARKHPVTTHSVRSLIDPYTTQDQECASHGYGCGFYA